MIDDLQFGKLVNADYNSRFLINDDYVWEFLDEYTFSKFVKEPNSPAEICLAEGNVTSESKLFIGKIAIFKHHDLGIMSGTLYLKTSAMTSEWETSINITKIERLS